MANKKAVVASSNSGIDKDNISLKISRDTNLIYWYIRFNIPLEAETVNEDNMTVIDLEGYVMKTYITYSDSNNTIAINPIDTYRQDTYYVLTISTDVKSISGNNLKQIIYVMFKIANDEISEYMSLNNNDVVPEAKSRPKNYDEMSITNKIIFSDDSMKKKVMKDLLEELPIKINFVIGGIGFLGVLLGSIGLNTVLVAVNLIVSVLGAAHIVFQITRKKFKALLLYNKGVTSFNLKKYEEANNLFQEAFSCDPTNKGILSGLDKVQSYL